MKNLLILTTLFLSVNLFSQNKKTIDLSSSSTLNNISGGYNEKVVTYNSDNASLQYFNIGADSIDSDDTLIFDMSDAYVQYVLVNEEVDSTHLINMQDGQQYTIVFIQDGTGYAIDIGTGFGTKTDNSADISTDANKHNIVQIIKYGAYIRYSIETTD